MKPIYLEPDEEITSVIDKLASSPETELAIVVPKNSTIFQSLVNVKLVAKQARELKKEVVFISNNKVGERLASQVGLKTYATLGTVAQTARESPQDQSVAEETLPDGTPVHRYAPDRAMAPVSSEPEVTPALAETGPSAGEKESTAPLPNQEQARRFEENQPSAGQKEELPAVVSRGGVKNLSRPEFSFKLPWRSAAVALAVVAATLLFAYVVIPKATVSLVLPSQELSQTLTMIADTGASKNSEKTVTAKLFEVNKSANKTINATGQKNVGTKATGSVAIRNCEDTNAYNLAAGARLTSSGKAFSTNKAVIIPAGKFSGGGTVCNSDSVTVSITADEAGESFNLTNATFRVTSLPARISGSGSTSGGTTKQVTVLTQEDLDKAFSELEKQVNNEALAEIKDKIGELTIIDGASWTTVEEKGSDHEVNAETDSTTVHLNAKVSAMAVDEAAIGQLLIKKMEVDIDQGHRLVFPEGSKPTINFLALSEDKKSYQFEVKASGFVIANINEKEVQRLVAHQSLARAEVTLKERFDAERVEVEVKPSWWWRRLPLLGSSIKVEYKFDEVSGT